MVWLEAPLVRALTLWFRPWGRRRVIMAAAVAVAVVGVALLVLVTGGVKYVFSHSMYLPILFSAAVFGPVGGVVAGLAGGLALGPLMPIDTQTGEMQDLLNWLYRTGFFVLAGVMTGLLVDAITRLAGQDPVSGAPSQVPLRHELHRSIERGTGRGVADFSLLLCKLSNHPMVIGALGRQAGRTLLRGFVARLQSAAGDDVRVYHLYAETFGMIVPRDRLTELRARVRDEVKAPVLADGAPVPIDLRMARADFPEHARAADLLIQQATMAIHLADTPDGRELVYDGSLEQRSRESLLLLAGLPEAIEQDQLVVHYQPQQSLRDRRGCGAEALVRWQHPELGLLSPARFVPQVEATELIHDLTAWVLTQALSDAPHLPGYADSGRVSVNCSASSLGDRRIIEQVVASLAVSGRDPSCLEVEVTESAVLADPVTAGRILEELQAMGVAVAIDDFGAGRTSLAELKYLSANRLKIDRRFIVQVCSDRRDQAIVASIVSLAHELGMDVVAEGIEDAQTLALLTDLGVDVAQDFHIARPVPLDVMQWEGPRSLR